MSVTVGNVTESAFEDGIEDYFQLIIYSEMRSVMSPFLDKYKGDSAFNEAMTSFINTLGYGLALYSLSKVMEYFYTRSKYYLAIWAFIVAGKVKQVIKNKMANSKFKGKKAFKIVGVVVGSDKTAERIEVSKMIQKNIDSYDQHKFHYENQNQNIKNGYGNFSNSVSKLKSGKDNKSIEMLVHKTSTGTWSNTTADKKIYEKATGTKLSTTGKGSWSSFHLQLNQFTDFHKTVDGKISNLTTALSQILASHGKI